jgi:hypothetical protein
MRGGGVRAARDSAHNGSRNAICGDARKPDELDGLAVVRRQIDPNWRRQIPRGRVRSSLPFWLPCMLLRDSRRAFPTNTSGRRPACKPHAAGR